LFGKGLLAGGFVLGIYGLTDGNDTSIRSALGLLGAGMLAMGYGLYRSLLSQVRQTDPVTERHEHDRP
jgi:hypothetical protein